MQAAVSPFPVNPNKQRRKASIDPDLMAVEHNAPPPTQRMSAEGKYHALFSLMKPGSCVRCEPGEINTVAHALKKKIEAGKYPALKGLAVRAAKCEDGHGRVWARKV